MDNENKVKQYLSQYFSGEELEKATTKLVDKVMENALNALPVDKGNELRVMIANGETEENISAFLQNSGLNLPEIVEKSVKEIVRE